MASSSTLKMRAKRSSGTSVNFTRLHGVILQKAVLFIANAVITSNLT
jgi:hypothetical protein